MAFDRIGHLQNVDFDSNGKIKTSEIGAGNKPVFFMVQGSYCGHCKTAKPDFARLFAEQGQRKVFMCTLQTDDGDPDVQKLMKRFPQILQNAGIQFNGVPTYILYKNGTYSSYEGPRDYASLKAFISNL